MYHLKILTAGLSYQPFKELTWYPTIFFNKLHISSPSHFLITHPMKLNYKIVSLHLELQGVPLKYTQDPHFRGMEKMF